MANMFSSRKFSSLVLVVSASIVLVGALPSFAGESFTAKVLYVSDGDTLVVSAGRQQTVVQLGGIDAPELSQEFGKAARDFLADVAVKKTVVVEVLERKPNRSIVARVTVDGKDLAQVLVEEGLAWASDDPSPAPLKDAEARAQAAGDGLWSTSNPTPPWQYRKAA